MSSALVVTTMIAFVVALATATPTSTRPVNIPSALPVGCSRDDGTVVVGLFPGGTKQTGCEYCECDGYGHVTCMYADCAPPRCVDPQKGECCSTCPNGENCRTPSGKVVKDGETLIEDGMMCSCSVGDNWMWWKANPSDGPLADCSPLTTVPPGCVMEDGSTMQLWEERLSPNGCKMCICLKPNSPPQCFSETCPLPPCADPLPSSDGCCPTCPNVETCKLDSGEIITMGQFLKKDGAVCKCRRKHSDLVAVCSPTRVLETMLKRLKAKLQKKRDQLTKKGIRKLNRRINELQHQLN